MDNILMTILIGALVGFVASLFLKRDGEMGWVANIVAGVVGTLLAGAAFGRGGFVLSVEAIFWDVLGAMAVIFVWFHIQKGR